MNEFMREILALPPQASSVAYEIDLLHYFVITVTMLGAFFVALMATYFTIRYRSSRNDAPRGRPVERWHPSWKIEGTIIFGLFALFIGWWVIGVRQYMHLQVPPEDTLDVYVVGKQWMWKFTHGNGKSSETRLHVPAGQPVKLVMTSRDVIHSFYVPAFRVKKDVVPGRYTTAWFEAPEPGVYPILCAEYCGTGHSMMRGEVVVMSDEAYQAWLERRVAVEIPGPVYEEPGGADVQIPADPLELIELGAEVAAVKGCLRCHTTDGSPHIGPSFAGLYAASVPLKVGGTILADEAYLTQSMMDPLAHVHQGYQPVMPSYRGLLDPAQTAALVEYIRSLAHLDRWNDPQQGRLPALGPAGRYPDPRAQGLPVYPIPTAEPREAER